jgi:hypothetical protein
VTILLVSLAIFLQPVKYVLPAPTQIAQIFTNPVSRHPLTGQPVEAELGVKPQIFGVMVENSYDAWPLSGIEEAPLVIEAPVEGSIPRLIAFFSNDQVVDKIGPVRSARPYYLDWAHEFDSLYAHVGGSPAALEAIKSQGLHDLNEFQQSEYFWRDHQRYAPHNVYTSTSLLNKSLEELQLANPNYQTWLFKDKEIAKTDAGLSVNIDWASGSTYDIEWRYQPETNDYLRYQAQDVYPVSSGQPVLADNVLVIAADMLVLDGVGRLQVDDLGHGDALLVQDGVIKLGTWKKPIGSERLRIYDEGDNEVTFNAGTTWIEVVASLQQVSTQTRDTKLEQ